MEFDTALEVLKLQDEKTYKEWQSIILATMDEKMGIDPIVEKDVLQGCLQRAITKRKWFWKITQTGLYNPFTGLLERLIGYEVSIGELISDEVTTTISRNDPAIALLDAYNETVKILEKRL